MVVRTARHFVENIKDSYMSTGYNQRRKVTKKVWKERAQNIQQHAALIARLVNAFMLARNGEAITFSAEQLEAAKAINVRVNAQPDGGLELGDYTAG
jgi:hypothetical protein